MGAAIRTNKPRTIVQCGCSGDRLPPCLPEADRILDEASLRSLLTLFELLDRWDLEAEDHEK
jgi:hypothetical protein